MKRRKRTGIISMLFLGIALILTGCGSGGGGGGGGGGTATDYTIGGTVNGLSGTLVLQNNGGDDFTITSDGTFTFATAIADGSDYNVTVKAQPSGQSCFVTNGSGTVSGAGVTDVTVDCYNSGSLDPTFDSDGTTPGIIISNGAAGGNGNDWSSFITTDANGKILVSGVSKNSSGNYDMVIQRYNADGTPDTTFGTDGIVVSNGAAGGNGNDYGSSITTDANGKILVSGWSYNSSGNWDMVIWRYDANGTPDDTFGTDGIVVSNGAAGGNGYDWSSFITTDADGKILVSGQSYNSSGNTDMVIWRYNANGTPDTTFGIDGIVVSNGAAGGNGNDLGQEITIDANGKILVTGQSWNSSGNYDMVIWQYNANGTPDTTFGTNGIVVSNNAAGGNGNDWGFSITTDANGKILVSGSSYNGSNKDMVIWRYNANGTPDTTFGTDGIVVSNNATGENGYDLIYSSISGTISCDGGFSITTDANGKVLVTGARYNGTDYDMAIWRYIP